MLRTFLPFSRVVSGRWPPAKNRLSPGSNPARSLIPRTDSRCFSRRKRTLWPWFFSISIPRMLVFIHVWLRLPREKFHAQLNYPWKVEWPNYWRCLIKKKHTQCLKITQNCESSSSKRKIQLNQFWRENSNWMRLIWVNFKHCEYKESLASWLPNQSKLMTPLAHKLFQFFLYCNE